MTIDRLKAKNTSLAVGDVWVFPHGDPSDCVVLVLKVDAPVAKRVLGSNTRVHYQGFEYLSLIAGTRRVSYVDDLENSEKIGLAVRVFGVGEEDGDSR